MATVLEVSDAVPQPESRPHRVTPAPTSYVPGCRRGCGIAFLAFVTLYVFNATAVLGANFYNQIKWHLNGSPNYIVTVEHDTFSPPIGESKITVQSGRVISATNAFQDRCGSCSKDLGGYAYDTIEAEFQFVYGCVLFFPLATCFIEYHPQLGYPTKTSTGECLFATDCSHEVRVTGVQLLPR